MPAFNKIKTWIAKSLGYNYFERSPDYWEDRYSAGGNSGSGSYGKLALFKAEELNSFVSEQKIQSVIEFGCGDGNQVGLSKYPQYIGLDVARTSIKICTKKFTDDRTKSFYLYDTMAFSDNHGLFKADLALSLDVIYHIVEDEIYVAYLKQLFNAGNKFVIIYSSDYDAPQQGHVRHRKFTSWIKDNLDSWQLIRRIPNKHPFDPKDEDTSTADFFVFQKIGSKRI